MQAKVIYVFYDVSHNYIFVVLDGSLEITVLSAKIVFFFFFMQFLRTFFNANVNFNKSGHYTTYRNCIFREN